MVALDGLESGLGTLFNNEEGRTSSTVRVGIRHGSWWRLIARGKVRRTGRIRWRPDELPQLCLAVMKLCGCPRRCVDRFDDLVPERVGDSAPRSDPTLSI